MEDKTRLSTNGPGPTMMLDNNCRSDQSGIGNDLPSYADVAALAASMSDKTKTKCSSTTSSKLPRRQPETKTDSDDDGFIGVQRKRNKIKKFFVSGISTAVNEEQITRYLQKRNITPTYISTFAVYSKWSEKAFVTFGRHKHKPLYFSFLFVKLELPSHSQMLHLRQAIHPGLNGNHPTQQPSNVHWIMRRTHLVGIR